MRREGSGQNTDWMCSLVGCGQNMNDSPCLLHCQVEGIVAEEGWGVWDCVCVCVREAESIRACERREEKKRGGERERERERERETAEECEGKELGRKGGSFRQQGWTSARSLQSLFCFNSLLLTSSPAAWPWPWWTHWSPCLPKEERGDV